MQKPTFGEDLDKPLGADRPNKGRAAHDRPYKRLALLGFAAIGVGLGGYLCMTGDPMGGQPSAVASIGAVKPPLVPQKLAAAEPASANDTTGSITARRLGAGNAVSVEETSGVKVLRPAGAGAPGAMIIEVPESLDVQLAPAPDKRISQKFAHGVLPNLAKDGSRAAEIYSRPLRWPKALKAGAPRIAIVVGGMGLSRNATAEALEKLPGEVTLAFAPYGNDLVNQAANARARGHEIMLQAPMEPFDYPANDPGPKTLIASADASQNMENLHWLMSRFPGYIGVVNFLGGKFTADAGALAPVLREIGERGLVYVDDGTSTRSLAKTLGFEARVPVVTSDVVIDAVQRPDAIDKALARLETAAWANGTAVGSATGLPLSLDRIARWTRGLQARGIALVPLSATALRPQSAATLPSPER